MKILMLSFYIYITSLFGVSESKCADTYFECTDGICIPPQWKCDGRKDCSMWEDERPCPNFAESLKNATEKEISQSKVDPVQCDERTQFQCIKSNKCISLTWRCDSFSDCFDGEDEQNCHLASCERNYYQCKEGRCIPESWVCDGNHDCADGSEETDCTVITATPDTNEIEAVPITPESHPITVLNIKPSTSISIVTDTTQPPAVTTSDRITTPFASVSVSPFVICDTRYEFRCVRSNKCIPIAFRCNRVPNCNEGEDEQNCKFNNKLPPLPRCRKSDFHCKQENKCIHLSLKCNGVADCNDFSDETNCRLQKCSINEFTCQVTKGCIHRKLECDGNQDCIDGTDESDCLYEECPSSMHACETTRQCIYESDFCDGKFDCDDRSDELMCAPVGPLFYLFYRNG